MTKEDLSNLLALGEGFTIEFKRAGTSNVGREICAFANATGGVILIGVTDAGEVVGVGNHNRLKSEVQSTARSAEPPIAVDVESIGDEQVTCALFRGATKTHILDRKEFTDDLYSIYEDCMAYLQAKLNTALIPHARGRDERLELPVEALREALVNAIVHRDYRSTANVQVYIFQDRLEIVTPGGLPAGMREEDLGVKSVPKNPLLFGIFHRMDLVEKIGSGIKRIRQMCRDYEVAEPVFEVSEHWVTTTFKRPTGQVEDQVGTKLALSRDQVRIERILSNSKALQAILKQFERDAGQVTGQVAGQVLIHCEEPRTGREIQELLGVKHRETFLNNYLKPLLKSGLIEMTIPDKPTSSKQKYRATEKGRALVSEVEGVQE